jgi:hypothetical protein
VVDASVAVHADPVVLHTPSGEMGLRPGARAALWV